MDLQELRKGGERKMVLEQGDIHKFVCKCGKIIVSVSKSQAEYNYKCHVDACKYLKRLSDEKNAKINKSD